VSEAEAASVATLAEASEFESSVSVFERKLKVKQNNKLGWT
jgi:hypothetical protein